MIRARRELLDMPPYKQGAFPAPGAVKLSSNENPYPPLAAVRSAIAEAAGSVNRYPSMDAAELVSAIARYHHVDDADIALGAGSVEVASQLIAATCTGDSEVIFPWPTFDAYRTLTLAAGARPVPVPLLPNGQHDLAAMAARITDRTRVVFVCTPNNPTGTATPRSDVREFLAAVPDGVLIAVDEAYVHFDEDIDDFGDVTELLARDNVAVLRTFSKAYGLAGLRVGYAVTSPEIVAVTGRVLLPFGVTDLAQRAAIVSLSRENELRNRITRVVSERDRVIRDFQEMGYALRSSRANFLWLPTRDHADALANDFADGGIMVRSIPREGVRITIGTPGENDRLLRVAREMRTTSVRQ